MVPGTWQKNREYEGKETVIVYDYVDRHIPVFDRMYAKRLRAYKQIGYEICTGIETAETKQTNAIFDIDNYGAVYRQDLLGASKEIVISSPGLLKRGELFSIVGGNEYVDRIKGKKLLFFFRKNYFYSKSRYAK